MRELTYNEAAVEAVAEEMRRDPRIFYMSTDAILPLLAEFDVRPAPLCGECLVARDGQQPSRNGRARLKRGSVAPDAEEDIAQ